MTPSLRTAWSRCRAMVAGNRLDRQFDEELTTHLELLVDEYRRAGLTPDDARREAVRRLGRPDHLRESHRELRGLPVVDVLAQDLRYAVRSLWKSPAFSAVVVLSLALGIGASTALFSLVDNLLLRSLPVTAPERLVQVQQVVAGAFKKPTGPFPTRVFDELRARSDVLTDVAGYLRLDRPLVAVDGAVEPGREVEEVSNNFFRDLGVTPVVGRVPEPADDAVAVIGYRLWRDRFGGTPAVLGRLLTVAGRPHEVVGVAPPRFRGISLESAADIWVSRRAQGDLLMIARVKSGVAVPHAREATQALLRQVHPQPEIRMPLETQLLPAGKGLSQLRAQYERPLIALAGLVTLVLLITCMNVGNLFTVRHAARRRELTVRAALGAGRSRLMTHCLVDAIVLAVLGGALGLVVARWGVTLILSVLPLPQIPDALAFQPDGRLLGFVAGLSLLSALLFGLAPARQASAVDVTALRSIQGTQTVKSRRLGRLMVACQVALSVILLVGAGLFVQTARNLLDLDLGFNPDRLVQVSIDTRRAGYGEGEVGSVHRLLLERVAAIPGVQSVTSVRNAVMQGGGSRSRREVRGFPLASDDSWESADVGPRFFETMGIPLVRGRSLDAADFERGRAVSVVNEEWVRRFLPTIDPIGSPAGIVGIVGDVKVPAVRHASGPMMYTLLQPEPDRINALEVRTVGDPEAVLPVIREAVRAINPQLFVGTRTMRQEIERNLARERLVAGLSGFFGLLGLLLVSIGIFGVASYTVAQRTRELGIRMALGAARRSVIREALRETMVVFGAGLAAGVVAAVVAVRLAASFIADLLFGLTATDALTVVAAAMVLTGVSIAACVLPARRAASIDPLLAIRQD